MTKPVLYQFAISPSCQRVFAVLAHKGIEYDVKEINIGVTDRPDEFQRVSPFGKVPVFEHDGVVMLESANIIQYIDEVWPEPAMMPSDPKERAYARQWMQFADRELSDRDVQFVHVEKDHDRKVKICREAFDVLAMLDGELAGKDGLFLGDYLSLVDCMLAPTLANVPVWANAIGDTKYETYTNVIAYTERLRANPVLAQTVFSVPVDVYEGFFNAVLVQGMTFPVEAA